MSMLYLSNYLYFYEKSRINELFDIIVDYPDSLNAIYDLKVSNLVQYFKSVKPNS